MIVDGLNNTHKNWWECDTGIAYLVANKPSEGWKGQHLKIYDLSDPAKPVYIRDFGLLGQQPGATSHEGVTGGIPIHGAISAGVDKESRVRRLRHGSQRRHPDSRPQKIADRV